MPKPNKIQTLKKQFFSAKQQFDNELSEIEVKRKKLAAAARERERQVRISIVKNTINKIKEE